MLMPRRLKHRKQHHPKRDGAAKGGTKLAFGTEDGFAGLVDLSKR